MLETSQALPESVPQAESGCDDIPVKGLEPEVLERMIDEATRKVVVAVRHEMHAGPMPAPKQFKQYDEVLPGTAEAIRKEFLANGDHVRTQERRALDAQIRDNRENRWVAATLVAMAFVLILVLAVTGHDTVAMAVAGTTVAAVIAGFLRPSINRGDDSTAGSNDSGEQA